MFVNDGSKDRSLEILEELASKHKQVKVINFSRNFGQRPALMAGFKMATGDVVINIDADLQDPASLIGKFVAKWEEGYDVVLAKRTRRKGESWFKKITSKIYYKVYRWITKSKTPLDCGISRLLSRRAIDNILKLSEHRIYLAGMTELVGFKQTVIEYDRDERRAGKTKYSVKSLFNLAINNILPYTSFPINFVLGLGLFLGVVGVMGLVALLVLLLCSVPFSTIWWLVAAITTATGVVTTSVGIVGLYVLAAYTETLNRPKYIIAQTFNLGEDNE